MGGQAYANGDVSFLDIRRQVRRGFDVHIAAKAVGQASDVIAKHRNEIPPEVPFGALTRVEPSGPEHVRMVFTDADGRTFGMRIEFANLSKFRAFYLRKRNSAGLVHINGDDGPFDAVAQRLGGWVRHESSTLCETRGGLRFPSGRLSSLMPMTSDCSILKQRRILPCWPPLPQALQTARCATRRGRRGREAHLVGRRRWIFRGSGHDQLRPCVAGASSSSNRMRVLRGRRRP